MRDESARRSTFAPAPAASPSCSRSPFLAAAIDAVDLSQPALEVARRNRADYGLGERIRLVRSDLFQELGEQRYDVIVSNPPYVSASSMQALPAEYRSEPEIALAGGEDGLYHIRTILHRAEQHLHAEGLLVVEVGHNRKALEQAFPRLPFTWLTTAGGEGFVFLLQRENLAQAG